MMSSIMEADRLLGVELRHLLALQAIAQEGSIGRAATALGYTQSAISQQIAALERAVGEKLIERPGGPRAVSLTEAGQLLLRHADAIVARMKAAQVDLAFVMLPINEGPLEAERLLVDPYVLVVPKDSPLAKREKRPTLREISQHPLIGYRQCRSNDAVETAIRRAGAEPNFVFRSDDNGTVQGLVGAGVGIALVPRLTLMPTDDSVEVIELGDLVPPRLIGIAWHRDRYPTPAARAFVETARDVSGAEALDRAAA